MIFHLIPSNTICYCGSGVEQLTRNEQVVGSNPTSSSKKTGFCKACFFIGQLMV